MSDTPAISLRAFLANALSAGSGVIELSPLEAEFFARLIAAGATISSTGGITLTPTTAGVRPITLTLDLTTPPTASSFRIKGYSPALEFLDKDGVQNWALGINDDKSDSFEIGRGRGPAQSVTPSLSIGKTTLIVCVGNDTTNTPAGVFSVDSWDNYGANDGVLWTRRHGTTGGNASNHSRFQHFSGSKVTEVVLSGLAARGTLASPTAVQSGDNLMVIDGRGYDGSATDYTEYAAGWSDGQASIFLQAAENWANGSHATKMRFYTTPTASTSSGATGQVEALRLESTGVVTLPKGQLAFPAVQNPSSDANTLDDYEEGTWTPVIGGSSSTSGQTYSAQIGSYTKIGRLVIANFTALFTAKGTITGNVQIQGLPFTAANVSDNPMSTFRFVSLNSSWVAVMASVASNTTTADVSGNTAAAVSNNTALTTSDLTDTTRFRGTLLYFATA